MSLAAFAPEADRHHMIQSRLCRANAAHPSLLSCANCSTCPVQGFAGATDRQPPTSLGSPDHFHRAHQKPVLQVLES